MEARAQIKYALISPRKVKIVCDLIRGKDANVARAILMNTPNRATEIMVKLLKSAEANAENNFNMDPSRLYVAISSCVIPLFFLYFLITFPIVMFNCSLYDL